MESDGTSRALVIPPFPAEQEAAVYFVKLSLRDAAGKEISSNFYWLPARLSTLAWDKTPDTAYTPIAAFEDLTDLNKLPRVKVEAVVKVIGQAGREEVQVNLHSPIGSLAFQVHAGIRKPDSEEEILPVL